MTVKTDPNLIEVTVLPVTLTPSGENYKLSVGNHPVGTIFKTGDHWKASRFDEKETFDTPQAAALQLLKNQGYIRWDQDLGSTEEAVAEAELS